MLLRERSKGEVGCQYALFVIKLFSFLSYIFTTVTMIQLVRALWNVCIQREEKSILLDAAN